MSGKKHLFSMSQKFSAVHLLIKQQLFLFFFKLSYFIFQELFGTHTDRKYVNYQDFEFTYFHARKTFIYILDIYS